jgi:hypothetical protein
VKAPTFSEYVGALDSSRLCRVTVIVPDCELPGRRA